jgi:hypothetical protein
VVLLTGAGVWCKIAVLGEYCSRGEQNVPQMTITPYGTQPAATVSRSDNPVTSARRRSLLITRLWPF